MTRDPYLLFLCLFVLSTATIAADPGGVIQLSERADIQDAAMMDKSILLLSERVSECVQRKAASPDKCFCLYPQELSKVRKIYNVTIKMHPTWANNVVSYVQESKTHAVSFAGLKQQLHKTCPGGS